MFLQYLFQDPTYFLYWIGISIFSVCLHELFHAMAAAWQGDTTARDQGYFTLNPLVHMGAASLVILLLTGMCWGACPVNPQRLRHAYSEAIVSFAGPFANLLLMASFALLGSWGLQNPLLTVLPVAPEEWLRFCYLASLTNATLFLLNMIPIPPLDGYAVLAYFMPGIRQSFAQAQGYLFPILFLALSMGLSRFLWSAGSFLSNTCFALGHALFS